MADKNLSKHQSMENRSEDAHATYKITVGSACDAPDHISDDSDYYSYPQTGICFSDTRAEAEVQAKELLLKERMAMSNTELNTISITYWIEEV